MLSFSSTSRRHKDGSRSDTEPRGGGCARTSVPFCWGLYRRVPPTRLYCDTDDSKQVPPREDEPLAVCAAFDNSWAVPLGGRTDFKTTKHKSRHSISTSETSSRHFHPKLPRRFRSRVCSWEPGQSNVFLCPRGCCFSLFVWFFVTNQTVLFLFCFGFFWKKCKIVKCF